jgi:hypothetical protein
VKIPARCWTVIKSWVTSTGIATPIIPIIIKDGIKVYEMCRHLFENGVFANPVVSPGAPWQESFYGQAVWPHTLRNS